MPSPSIERIGIDESGKGDYFGPLVVAAVFVDATTQNELALMAVRDSKKISDSRILELAPDIKTICPHSVIVIGPQKYNELYLKIKNLNRLLAWGHAKALETLLDRVSCERAISDQFGDERLILNALQEKGRKIVLEQRTKAESDLAVAAAQSWPLGATTVSASVSLAHRAGIAVFATGGIGGVHRGAEATGDISADLDAMAQRPVITVCAKDPVQLGQVPAYDKGSGTNIAYTSLNMPTDAQLSYLLQLMPDVRNIAILVDSTNKSSVETQAKPLEEAARKRGIDALIVAVAKSHCRSVPLCATCPLRFDLRGRPPAPTS